MTGETCPHTITDISGRRWVCVRPPHDDPGQHPGRNPSHGGDPLIEANRHRMKPSYAVGASKPLRD